MGLIRFIGLLGFTNVVGLLRALRPMKLPGSRLVRRRSSRRCLCGRRCRWRLLLTNREGGGGGGLEAYLNLWGSVTITIYIIQGLLFGVL